MGALVKMANNWISIPIQILSQAQKSGGIPKYLFGNLRVAGRLNNSTILSKLIEELMANSQARKMIKMLNNFMSNMARTLTEGQWVTSRYEFPMRIGNLSFNHHQIDQLAKNNRLPE